MTTIERKKRIAGDCLRLIQELDGHGECKCILKREKALNEQQSEEVVDDMFCCLLMAVTERFPGNSGLEGDCVNCKSCKQEQ